MLAAGQHEREQLTERERERDAGREWTSEAKNADKVRAREGHARKINAESTRDVMSWHFFLFFFTLRYNGGLEPFTAEVTLPNGGTDGWMEKGFKKKEEKKGLWERIGERI